MTLVLIVNTGSSSLKWSVLDAESEAVQKQGEAHWENDANGHQREIARAVDEVGSIDAVGHRVVHGGMRFRQAVIVDDAVRDEILRLADLAPLHNPAAVAGIDAVRERMPSVPQVAAFDTAFHATMPDVAAVYSVPRDWTTRWGLRRFGFHGLSVSYAVERTRELLGQLPPRLVVCHLGAGCSVTAVADGHSVNTSMGFTPLEGLMMAQRSGSVDPGLLLYLLMHQGLDAAELDQALNARSGLLGVSQVSADLRQVLAAAEAGNADAQLARDMFTHRLVSCVGSMIATLGGLDVLVFTGGIGEHSAEIRAATCKQLAFAGLRFPSEASAANQLGEMDRVISGDDSAVRVLVIAAREDLAVLRNVKQILNVM